MAARDERRILGRGFRFTEHADFTVNSLGVISHSPKDKNFRQDLQDVQDGMQGSLETPLRGDPKAAPWEQWEALEHKNKPARLNPPKGVRPTYQALALWFLPSRISYVEFNRIGILPSKQGGIQLGELIFCASGVPILFKRSNVASFLNICGICVQKFWFAE